MARLEGKGENWILSYSIGETERVCVCERERGSERERESEGERGEDK